jgi:hypothetical protein
MREQAIPPAKAFALRNIKRCAMAAKKKKIYELSYEWQRLDYFFALFELKGPDEELWEILKLALIADNDQIDERERGKMIFFYEYTKELFENIFILLQDKKKAVSKKSS